MTTDPSATLYELFEAACQLEGEEQSRFLDGVRRDRPELAEELVRLLSVDAEETGQLPDDPAEHRSRVVKLADEAYQEELAGGQELSELAAFASPSSRYELRGEIGRGGMGAVLRVWDKNLRRPQAMKVVLGTAEASGSKSPAVDGATLGRFVNEAQVTGQLDHPGIVSVTELGCDSDGRAYFTMKLVQGRDLNEVFDRVDRKLEDWTQARALNVLLKVCEAMAYAHSKGVIHRDLKPANVMVGSFGEVYVMDWGIARVRGAQDSADDGEGGEQPEAAEPSASSASAASTRAGTVLGTPYYMPPEQAAGRTDLLDAPADVYAVGAMLYRLLAGRAPYADPERKLPPHTVLARVIQDPPTPLGVLAPDAPAELVSICEKAMARDPSDRYAHMRAFADDLRAFLEGRVVRAYETGAWAEARKWIGRNRGLAGALSTAVVLLITGLITALILRGQAISNAARAKANEEKANETALREKARADEVLRLSAAQDLSELLAEAKSLWPPHPNQIDAYEDWIGRASGLVAELPRHRTKHRELEQADDSPSPNESQRAERWWTNQLARLIAGLESLEADLLADGSVASSPEHGWSMRRRLAFARDLRDGFAAGGRYRSQWEAALPDIAEVYPDLELTAQMGLVPLGPDPRSGLWEFADLASGLRPERDSDGELVLAGDSAQVFILVPGATFAMGAREADRALAHEAEYPVHEITLDPFFLSKFELTQGQWLYLRGTNPFVYGSLGSWNPDWSSTREEPSLLHPAENFNWYQAEETLTMFGFDLPTEAQWEFAAGFGTDTSWWCGTEPTDLEGVANVADSWFHRYGGFRAEPYESRLDDGFAVHAPVGRFAPNDLGFHDVYGNVMEWCRDTFGFYNEPVRAGDGLRLTDIVSHRAMRGGSYLTIPKLVRTACRFSANVELATTALGVRASRAIDPP